MRRPLLLALLVLLSGCGSRPPEHVEARAAAPPVVVTVAPSTTTTSPTTTSTTSTTVTPRPRARQPVAVASYRPVDAGTFRRIGGCESSGDPTGPLLWTKQNPHSTASGAYQDLDSTWSTWAKLYGSDVDASSYARAMFAPPDVQQVVNERAFEAQGTAPWLSSRACWG